MNQTADAFMGIFGFKRVKEKKMRSKSRKTLESPPQADIASSVNTKTRAKKKKPFRAKLSTLQAKADAAASIYIRMKAADHAGCVTCITCGKYLPWTDAHCAHYIERAKKATRWTEENLAAACPGCNVYRKEFHMREYTLYMIDTYGREKITQMKKEASVTLTPSQVRSLAEEALEYYTNAIKEL